MKAETFIKTTIQKAPDHHFVLSFLQQTIIQFEELIPFMKTERVVKENKNNIQIVRNGGIWFLPKKIRCHVMYNKSKNKTKLVLYNDVLHEKDSLVDEQVMILFSNKEPLLWFTRESYTKAFAETQNKKKFVVYKNHGPCQVGRFRNSSNGGGGIEENLEVLWTGFLTDISECPLFDQLGRYDIFYKEDGKENQCSV